MAVLQASVATFVYFLGCVVCAPTSTHHSNLIKWVKRTEVSWVDLEPVGGEIREPFATNLTSYLARAVHIDSLDRDIQTGIIPGKVFTGSNSMQYSLNGNNYRSTNFEVLTYPKGAVSWIPGEKISTLDEKVVGGIDPFTSEVVYLCRLAHVNGSYSIITPGKLMTTGECLLPYWEEISSEVGYEVLVVNAYGKFIDA